jgi:hypothetical protein
MEAICWGMLAYGLMNDYILDSPSSDSLPKKSGRNSTIKYIHISCYKKRFSFLQRKQLVVNCKQYKGISNQKHHRQDLGHLLRCNLHSVHSHSYPNTHPGRHRASSIHCQGLYRCVHKRICIRFVENRSTMRRLVQEPCS